MRAYIFGAGEYDGALPDMEEDALILAADGGYRFLAAHGVTPDLLLGDFDSLEALPEGVETLRFPVEKDDTDMAIAVWEALSRGAEELLLYGGMGGRLDHTLANLTLLAWLARRGIRARLVSERASAAALRGGTLHFPAGFSGGVSVFAFGGTAVVTERGLKYGLDRYPLRDDVALGVSNEFMGREAAVTAHEGTVLVVWQGNRGLAPATVWENVPMRLLFEMDLRDYDPGGRVFRRDSARCIAIRGGRVAMVHSARYDYYKFPGGGIEAGESPVAALIRETREETGFCPLLSTIREYGRVHRVQRSDHQDQEIFLQENYYYLCQLSEERSAQRLDDYEREEGFALTWVEPRLAIEVDRRGGHGEADLTMLERDARVLELLITEGYFHEA